MMVVAMAVAAIMPAPATAGLFDFVWGKVVEDPIKDTIEDSIKKAAEQAVIDALTGKNRTGTGKANENKANNLPPPVASTVSAGDYRHLPLTGDYRFPVPKKGWPEGLEIGPSGGYIDRFGSEWIPYRARKSGRILAWRSNLSKMGKLRMGKLADERGLFLVRPDGEKVDLEVSRS